MTDAVRFDGEVVVVTGAGHGLGRGYALALAERGAAVVCNDVAADRAEAVVAEIVATGGTAVAETSSVATATGGAAVVGAALDAFGRVDAVVNNAGQLRNAAFEDLSEADLRDVLDVHLAGAFFVTQPAYRHMRDHGGGRIVFTSSSAGMFGGPWQANYGAAKAGLVGLCNVVALEGAAHGIRANAVLPMALTGIGDDGPPPYPPDLLRETAAALGPLVPDLTVGHVVPLVVYLASAACTETRRVLSVGAGHLARVYVGMAEGWVPDAVVTPEAVAERMGEIVGTGGIGVPAGVDAPESMNDATRGVVRRLGRAPGQQTESGSATDEGP